MRKKIVVILLMLISIMMFTVGCSGKDKEVFLKYQKEDMKPVLECEKKFLDSYNSVTGTNYKDDATTLKEFKKNTVPNAEKWVKAAESVKGDSSELAKGHKFYVEGVKNAQKATKMIVEAMEKNDKTKATEANMVLAKEREQMTQYQNIMKELSKKYDAKK